MDEQKFLRQLRFQLHSAANRQETCVFFEAIRYYGKNARILREFISDLKEEGYSVRTIMQDSQKILRYRVFLPKGARINDMEVVKSSPVPYEDPLDPSFKQLQRLREEQGELTDD